ncbi:Ephrin type-A receptor 6, partial [Goodea atripinnis]
PPSPPRNLMFNMNDTCLMLEWLPPSDTGGRRDLTYNVQCKRCGPATNQCQICEEELRFLPRPLGLTNATVTITDFSSHANYTFEIESLNGVSDMSSFPRQVAIITVSTDQGGEYVEFAIFHTNAASQIFSAALTITSLFLSCCSVEISINRN